MRKKWTCEEESFIRDNISLMTIKELSEHFNVGYWKIVDKIHKMHLSSKKARNIIWSQDEDSLLKEHFEYAPKNYLMSLFENRSWNAILQRGIKTLKLNRLSQDKISVNYKFFDNWTCKVAYIHGFILADGHIHLGKDNYLQISLKKESIDILEKIATAMEFKGEIYQSKNRNSCTLQIKNIHIIKQLQKLGISCNDKSHNASYPINIVPEKYLRDNIRGLIDGDGWSRMDKDGIYNIGLCGTENVVDSVKNLLPIDCSDIMTQHYEPNCWRFNIKGKRALLVASWLYDNSSIYLDEKYKVYKRAYRDYILRHTGNRVRTGRETQ